MLISVAKEFSDTPGPRSRDEGDYSGELFLEQLLRPRFIQALEAGEKLIVDLDGTEGYATSFLEGAFGGLAREYDIERVLNVLEFKCDDEPSLKEEITKYIREAREAAKR